MKAFTLIELLITIAIIGIVSLISVPIYKNMIPALDLGSASRDVASDLRYAQQLAVTEQKIYSVIFDIGTRQYVIINDAGEAIRAKTLGSRISLTEADFDSSTTVSFISTGAVIHEGSVLLQSQNGGTATILVKPSGYVKIQ